VLFNICDSKNESYDPINAYDVCLLFLVNDFVGDQTFGTPASRMQLKEDADAQIKEWKEGGVVPFVEMASRMSIGATHIMSHMKMTLGRTSQTSQDC
jgi:hypothetical protein